MSATEHNSTPGLARRIVLFPLTRLVLAMTFVIVGALAASLVVRFLSRSFGFDDTSVWRDPLAMVVFIPAVYVSYRLYVQFVERRPMSELSRFGSGRELIGGVVIGTVLFAAVVGAIALCGGYRVIGTNPLLAVLPIFAASVIAGYVEEVISRGIVFRIVEDGLGTWAALGISAALFGILHHGNPNATWLSSLSIALTAGVLLGATYVVTRRLWVAIGIHFAWNFTQGGIFGIAVSGHDVEGLLQSELSGPDLIAGGAFGAEASIFALVFCLPLATYYLVRGHRLGRFIRPMWKRGPEEKDAAASAYWINREHMRYYKMVLAYAKQYVPEGASVLDVGTHRAQYLTWFDWIPEKVAIDLRVAPAIEGVVGIQADFFEYEPERRFDLVLCLQVLEHLDDPGPFCARLLAAGRTVIISVPYKWREGWCKNHVQDPVDEAKLEGWVGQSPIASAVVRDGRVRRLVSVYRGATDDG